MSNTHVVVNTPSHLRTVARGSHMLVTRELGAVWETCEAQARQRLANNEPLSLALNRHRQKPMGRPMADIKHIIEAAGYKLGKAHVKPVGAAPRG